MGNPLTQIVMLRHGEPQGADRLLGHTDPELTEKGWLQCELAINGLRFDRVISSPLRRCSDFARYYVDAIDKLPLAIDSNWAELNFGSWDGLTFEHLWQQHRTAFIAYRDDPFNCSPPDGESTDSLIARINQGLDEIAQRHPSETILIVTHAGVLRAMLAILLNQQPSGNTHLSRVDVSHAALLTLTLYHDDDSKFWPQLTGLLNSQTLLNGVRG